MSVDISQIEPIYGVKVENIKEESDIISQDLDVKTEKILPKSDIWVDGVRVDGYNTHLYEYDGEKFVTKNSTKGLLSIQEGASIKIWLDSNSFGFIKDNNGCILIDDYVDNNLVLTEYPCYYDNQKLLHEALNESTDLNAVVEFTFRDNKWFYSGGLRVTYSGDVDITVNSSTTKEINVIGVNLGQYKDKDTIDIGTSLEDIISKMLCNEIDVIATKPSVSISIDGIKNGNIYEVGSQIKGSIKTTYTDGKFTGDTGHSYTQIAGCEPGNITYYKNNTNLESSSFDFVIGNEKITFNCTQNYEESSNVPVKNTGKDSSVKITEGTATSNSITIYGKYKYFYGIGVNPEDEPMTLEKIEQFNHKEWLNDSENILPTEITSTDEKPCLFLVIPQNWEITQTKNSLGGDALDVWRETSNTIEKYGIIYKIWYIFSQGAITFKEITISKK